MKRELKFRVWDKEDRRMITHEQGFIPLKVCSLGVLRLDPHNEENLWKIMPTSMFELMQFTGLKDKNGKEIYEGDVVQSWAFNGEPFEVFYWSEMMAFAYRYAKEPETKMYWTLLRKPELDYDLGVLGNIYENPELIPAPTPNPK